MPLKSKGFSDFAIALRYLMESFDYDLVEWGKLLQRPPEKIQAWLDDLDIPSQHSLCFIVAMVDYMDCAEKELWYEMAERRATSVSPHGARMLPTVKVFCERTVFDSVSSVIAKMNPAEQEKYLLEKYP